MIPITRRSCYSLRRTLSGLDLPHLASGGYIDTRPPVRTPPDHYADNAPPSMTLPPPHSLSICTTGNGQYLTKLGKQLTLPPPYTRWTSLKLPTRKLRKLK